MTYEETWAKVEDLPETAKTQMPMVLSEITKKKLSRMSPEQIREIVGSAIDEVNHGSVVPLDELVKRRL